MAQEYQAPVDDLLFGLKAIAGLDELNRLEAFAEATPDLVEAVLEEAGRFAGEVLAPINATGDRQGSLLKDGGVILADGFADAYRQFVANGWPALDASPEHGGQGMPKVVGTAVNELWQSANMAFALGPMLTNGAIDAVEMHASEALKQLYLKKLISGEWTGTMNLTEPQAGSDLSAVRTRAVPEGEHYRVSGQKIFITWGDHEAAENIIHLVLARLPDAPEGTRGISLFLVPKFLVNDDGSLGERNDLQVVNVEHKLGIHGSPTCTMSFGDSNGAIGFLIGEENKGLACMFTMMNAARLAVGLQGVSIGDRAYQAAAAYACERVQGFATGRDGCVAIIEHPDIRRMLLTMRALTEAGRALSLYTVAQLDRANQAEDFEARRLHQARVDLLTPIVKGWVTENAQEVASLGIQVHGGMGYIEETGVAQYLRDARITTIYEGTTGIQALDLVGRKTLRDRGAASRALIGDMRKTGQQLHQHHSLADWTQDYDRCIDQAESALNWLLSQDDKAPRQAASVAVPYLMLFGAACGCWMMVQSALAASEPVSGGSGSLFYRNKLVNARFYLDHIAPRAAALLCTVQTGSRGIGDLSADDFVRGAR